MPRKPAPVPAGFRTVTPYLTVRGAARAIEWYKKAFGAQELTRERAPDGRLMHASIKIGDSIVMLSDDFSPRPRRRSRAAARNPVTLHVYSKSVNSLWRRATTAGARVVQPLENRFWGERFGQLRDPFGNVWGLSMRVPMSRRTMEQKRRAAMAAMPARPARRVRRRRAVRPAVRRATRPVARRAARPAARRVQRRVTRRVARPAARRATRPAAQRVQRRVTRRVARPAARRVQRRVTRRVSRPAARRVVRRPARTVRRPAVRARRARPTRSRRAARR